MLRSGRPRSLVRRKPVAGELRLPHAALLVGVSGSLHPGSPADGSDRNVPELARSECEPGGEY